MPPDHHDKWMSGGGIRQCEAEEEGKCGGRRGYKEGNGIQAEGSNELLSAAGKKTYREIVAEQDRTDRRCHLPEM